MDFYYALGTTDTAFVDLFATVDADSRGNGTIGGGVTGGVLSWQGTLASVTLRTTRKSRYTGHMSGQFTIWDQAYTLLDQDFTGRQTIPGRTLLDGTLAQYQVTFPIYGVPVTLGVRLVGEAGYRDGMVRVEPTPSGAVPGIAAGGDFKPYVRASVQLSLDAGIPGVISAGVGSDLTLYDGEVEVNGGGMMRADADITGGASGAMGVYMDLWQNPSRYLDGKLYVNFVQELPGTDQAADAAKEVCDGLGNLDPGVIVSNVNNAIADVGDTASKTGKDFGDAVNTLVDDLGSILPFSSGGGMLRDDEDPSPFQTWCGKIVDTVANTLRLHYQYTIFKWPGLTTTQERKQLAHFGQPL